MGFEDELRKYHERRRRYSRHLMTMVVFFLVVGWYLWGLKDWVTFEFSEKPESIPTINTMEVGASLLPHNGYIRVRGITEHRGLTQKFMRGLSFEREEFWYFRLVGSDGVFIEVAANEGSFGIAQRVEVEGRVIDPTRDSQYRALMRTYQTKFGVAASPDLRIVQVSVEPGQRERNYYILFGLLALLLAMNIWTAVRLIQIQRQLSARFAPITTSS